MSLNSGDEARKRRDAKALAKAGKPSMDTRDKLKGLRPYLPHKPSELEKTEATRRKSVLGVRRFLVNQLHLFVYFVIHMVFSTYIRTRQAYHFVRDQTRAVFSYHHRTPEIIAGDVKGFARLPRHLSVALRLEESNRTGAELERLVNEVADIAAWCACAGIPMLSVYEKTGILKGHLNKTHRAVSRKLAAYYGPNHPAVTLGAPHMQSIESAPQAGSPGGSQDALIGVNHVNILLISAEDGRDSLVDLTRTLTDMAQRNKCSPADITLDLVDNELTQSVMGEPDLLILFSPHVELNGYPPWQIRLTEIFHMQDNNGVGYQVFLRGLHNFQGAKMRFGK